MGFILAALAVVAVAISTYATIQSLQQQSELQKAVQKQQEIEAQAERDVAAFEEKQARRRHALLLGKQQAIFAAAGVDPTMGTPLFMELDLVKQGEMDALNIRAFGARAANARLFESSIARFRAQNARAGIPLAVIGGIASAASAGAGAYASYTARQTPRATTTDWT